jgi:hypothetical protein
MTNPLASPAIAKLTSLVANAQRALPPGPPRAAKGSIVRVLSDGTIGEAVWASPLTVLLVHGDRSIGRGPWVMRREQLEVAGPADAAAYCQRCAALVPGE